MTFKIYDYVNASGENEIKTWTKSLQKTQRGKLSEKIDKLILYGDGLYPKMLTGTDEPGIQKLRIRGNVELRPLLCKGPINTNEEYTLLKGAKEVGDKLIPQDSLEKAKQHKAAIKLDPNSRRKIHERIL